MSSSNNDDLEAQASNMATIGRNQEYLLQNLVPRIYAKGEDIEDFIKKCRRFFKSAGYNKAEKERLIVALLDEDAAIEYEKIDAAIGSYEDRLRKAFQKPNTLKGDWEDLLSIKKVMKVSMFTSIS